MWALIQQSVGCFHCQTLQQFTHSWDRNINNMQAAFGMTNRMCMAASYNATEQRMLFSSTQTGECVTLQIGRHYRVIIVLKSFL